MTRNRTKMLANLDIQGGPKSEPLYAELSAIKRIQSINQL